MHIIMMHTAYTHLSLFLIQSIWDGGVFFLKQSTENQLKVLKLVASERLEKRS